MSVSDAVVVVIVWFVLYLFLGPIWATLATILMTATGMWLKNKPVESE